LKRPEPIPYILPYILNNWSEQMRLIAFGLAMVAGGGLGAFTAGAQVDNVPPQSLSAPPVASDAPAKANESADRKATVNAQYVGPIAEGVPPLMAATRENTAANRPTSGTDATKEP
jgi:hypothetical protein